MRQDRYSRHYSLREIGIIGQQKLSQARVLIIGLGGLGCPLSQILSASGIGALVLVDGDKIEESNLARQLLFGPSDIGKYKAEVARRQLEHLNPDIEIIAHAEYFEKSNAEHLLQGVDVIVDCSDNYKLRYLLSDFSESNQIPMVYAALYKWEGQISVLNFNGGPSYRDLYPNESALAALPSCSEVGVVSSLPATIGAMQATETIKIILGSEEVLSGKLLNYNALKASFYSINTIEKSKVSGEEYI